MIFSLIIPSLNRCDTLAHTLYTLREQDFDDVEFIISNNHSHDGTEDLAHSLMAADRRFRYVKTPQVYAMNLHWEFALSHARGQYLSFIGDDDGLMPNGLNYALSIIKEYKDVEALNSFNMDYHWPSSVAPHHAGISRIPSARTCYTLNSRDTLRAFSSGQQTYDLGPMLYRGWVRKSLLDLLKVRTGCVFRSSQPDVYTSIALASIGHSFILTERPLFIEGGSGHSNGAQGSVGTPDKDTTFFAPGFTAFHAEVPFCATTPFLMQESLLHCRDAGLVGSDALIPWPTLIEKAKAWCLNQSAARFAQSLEAMEIVAAREDIAFDPADLRARFDRSQPRASPFPAALAWPEKFRWTADAFGFRTHAFGIRNLSDLFDFLARTTSAQDAVPACVRSIAEQGQLIREQAELLKSHSADVEDSVILLCEKNFALSHMQQRLHKMEHNPFWRLTWPLRFLTRFILRLYRSVRQ